MPEDNDAVEPKPANPKSPATKWVRTLVAAAFVLVWMVVVIIDFFFAGGTTIPFWFQATGLVVLGFLLGVSLDDMRSVGGGRR